MGKWLTRAWWQYLLAGRPSWGRLLCRAKGHPNGVWWFNVGGVEPDMRCKDCGENLG
jgi:hypothetical protein